jgi:hypothetical protein
MILISHRGNINGKSEYENGQKYCEKAIQAGYNVEIDVHWYDGIFWTGHDKPQYRVDPEFFKRKDVWCHAKDIKALRELQKINAHCFWHQEDDVTLTSKGYIWTYPGKPLTDNSIAVLPENNNDNVLTMLPKKLLGICSDYIQKYK